MPAEENVEPIMAAALHQEDIEEKKISLSAARHGHQAICRASGFHQDRDASVAGMLEPFPTPEELATLRRVPNKIPIKLFTIGFVELCERFSFYGTTAMFTNFIEQPLPQGSVTGASLEQPGAMGLGQRASTGITTLNQVWQYFMPLFGAWIADAKLGRYRTITTALAIDILGHVILVMSAIPPIIVRQGASMALLIIAILVMGIGTGGVKPNLSCLIVEQLGEQHMFVKSLPSGERVIVDPAITIERIYNWFYFFINFGALIGVITMVYAEQYVGFYLSYTLPTIILGLGPLVMWWGRSRYVGREPAGSVLLPAVRTFFLAQAGRWSINPYRTWKNMNDGTFWENVKPSKFPRGTQPSWMTFDDAWVDELRRGFAACAVFCWTPVFWLCYNQVNNNLISQAAVLQRDGVPNDILSNLNPFSLLVFIPLNDFLIYPALRKAGVRLTPIKKITLGFYVGSCAMIWAAVVQYHIYQKSVCGRYASGRMWSEEKQDMVKCPPVDIKVWAQAGSYVLIALSEVFASITALEYAYSKAPKNMRSMVQALALFTTSFSAAIGQAFVGLSADPLLVWNYGVVAILAIVVGTCFYFHFRALDIHEDDLNELPEGTVGIKVDMESPYASRGDEKRDSNRKPAVCAVRGGVGDM
ncbi:oligopeptide transporter [Purpureocillium lilacinum]|uniref:Oligopeptide transporter n=1 Tax=Purpureocillium lilacinum TaxID=33203 RepID=A0A179H6Y8_PURLI|nr:oligopeptide transporter [Purpureocillium lilacinum]OAQ85528.1 oligopeptide transporter [Purpureocillium lilacinum]